MIRIGIAGASCSGKSTIAADLARRLGTKPLSLDDFYRSGAPKALIGGVRSFERPEQYDGEALARALPQDGNAVAEGFLLLRYPGIVQSLTTLVFLDLPWTEIRRRRALRPRADGRADAAFDAIGELEWRRFGERQRDLPGVTVLDGTSAPAAIADDILRLALHTPAMTP